MGDSNATATFTYVARELGRRKIAFICAREHEGQGYLGPQLRQAFGGVYVANEGFTPEAAERAVQRGDADAVAFGKLFIANPDLPQRIAQKAGLNAWRTDKFYLGGAEGYVDYPALNSGAAKGQPSIAAWP